MGERVSHAPLRNIAKVQSIRKELWPMLIHVAFKGVGRVAPVAALLCACMFCGCVGTPPRVPPSQQPGVGALSCSAGQEWCNGDCRDPGFFINNDQNCGRCGNFCSPSSEACNGVSCGCAAGYTSCMGSCVSSTSFFSDNNNCGSCGHSCGIGESCTGGVCQKMFGRRASDSSKANAMLGSAHYTLVAHSPSMSCSSVLSKIAPLCSASVDRSNATPCVLGEISTGRNEATDGNSRTAFRYPRLTPALSTLPRD